MFAKYHKLLKTNLKYVTNFHFFKGERETERGRKRERKNVK